ncbi:MAG: prolyl oligopeptidase family serine peptidase [Myxococcota bacterium]|nr:prolyl oligopeptidase family serine peptidase [Myxococcota bacterium]
MLRFLSMISCLALICCLHSACGSGESDRDRAAPAKPADTKPAESKPADTGGTGAPMGSNWKSPPKEVLDVLHAPQLPRVWTSPTGKYMLLADPVLYPPLAELAAPMHKLAGIRVDPVVNAIHGRHGATSPRLVSVHGGSAIPIELPKDAEVYSVAWTANGERFALTVRHPDHMGLWVGSVDGKITQIEGVAINLLLDTGVRWMPDQERLLVRRIPERGQPPKPPAIPAGPAIVEGAGAKKARSTYESRNLLETAHDDALFEYYTTCELVVVDPKLGQMTPLGSPAIYATSDFSPDGEFLLIERLKGPWSHEVPWWRFASELEVWDKNGTRVATIASLPLANQVPSHGVRLGPRGVSWRATAPHTLFWVEALDGGDPVAKAPHRDRLMRLNAPFKAEPEEVFKAEHRIRSWQSGWGSEGGTLMLTQRERIRRWRYTWLLDVDKGTSRLWFDLNERDSYASPGHPLHRPLPNGRWVLHQQRDGVYFSGRGATDQGDRPFLDLRSMKSGDVERLFRSDPERYESFVAFAGADNQFVMSSESTTDVPNYHLATLKGEIEAAEGDANWSISKQPITRFKDPTPQLRKVEKRIVRYKRKDGVPLSFQLHLPPDYQEGTRLPTVLYAYPLEYSDPKTAGQVRGSTRRFSRIRGASHLFFLLQGYAVLNRTTMPMLGDPETTYDTFVPQLVADAEAAVAKAIEIGVADPERIGVIGHSHGGLMVANLLAHTDLFAAGIARSGSYNKTNQPFGFQSERRSLFQARDVYIQVSPTFFADKIKEPVLVIHGDADSNPGTLTPQSEVFFEAVRGSGGTARLVLLPHEDHGYRARESVEHVLWEQLRWFDKYVKGSR